jgi:hypothetical protein
MRWSLVSVLLLLGALAHGRRAPAPRYLLEIAEVQATPGAPAEISVKARTVLGQILAGRPEFVARLEGAPDPKTHPAEYRRFLDARHVRAFAVQLKVDDFARALVPATKPGASGQVLTIKVGVSLVGSQIPGDALALAGSGGATVMAEVGETLRPREEEGAIDDALRDALTHAVDDAVSKLSAPPRATKPKKR